MTRFGTVWPATQLRFEASGLEAAVGYTVTQPAVVVPVAVTFSTTAVASGATPKSPRRGKTLDPPGPNLGPVILVSKARCGVCGWNVPGGMKVKWSAVTIALVPAVVVTLTSTVPATCAGLIAVIWLSELTTKLVPAVAPNMTTTPGLLNSRPVLVTTVPPAVGPLVGDTLVTVGTVQPTPKL